MAKLKTDDARDIGKVTGKTCDFCNELGLAKFTDKNNTLLGIEYQAALARRWWKKSEGKRSAGMTLNIKNKKTSMAFKLNFCPECGKELRKNKNSHAEDIRKLLTKDEITAEDMQAVIDKWKEEAAGHE